ncbi:hypothetical protein E3P79_01801 [Wallemia ichthyophaga]|nr:hypothetical protein E3P79_01801 [Wallemia ichthyophaga]
MLIWTGFRGFGVSGLSRVLRAPRVPKSNQVRHKSTHTYTQRLQHLSQRTGTDPISLSASFAILHELTAIFPVIAIFGGLHWFGVGERSLEWLWGADSCDNTNDIRSWTRAACEEGERRLDRFRQRYNLWQDEENKWDGSGRYTAHISEAIAAYTITKVLLPVRILACLYYSPRFSVFVFEPIKRGSRFTADKTQYQQLRAHREVERLEAIRDGQIPDPSQGGMSLSDAITLRGTCTTMCPLFERVEREYQLNLDKWEVYVEHPRQANPARTVKTFHRPAAGDEASLPSDVRPAPVLKQTLDYLFHTILAEDADLHDSHHFLRDRTRSIRQDFTLQHIRDRVAVECHERIARYHILCLHELCERTGWSDQQELEQLSKVLLSLTEFYDDWRASTGETLPNEAEFRAYHLLIHLRDSSTAAAAERLPTSLYLSQPIQLALKFHALARRSNEADVRGRPHNTVSSPNGYSRFFKLIRSSSTPFLMACLLEPSFSSVRRGALKAMRVAYPSKYRAYPVADLVSVLGCDDGLHVAREAENLGLDVERGGENEKDNDNGNDEAPPTAVRVNKQSQVNDSGPTIPHCKSRLVSAKRGRLSARDVIDTPLAIDFDIGVDVVAGDIPKSKPASLSSLRPSAPVFTMPSTKTNANIDSGGGGYGYGTSAGTDTGTSSHNHSNSSPTSLMPPPPKPIATAFSFQPRQTTQHTQGAPSSNAFSWSGTGTGTETAGAFANAFTPPSTQGQGQGAQPDFQPDNDLDEKHRQQQQEERERQKKQKAAEAAEATEAAQLARAAQSRRRLSENRKLQGRLRAEEEERKKTREEERGRERERLELTHTTCTKLTDRILDETVAAAVRSCVLREVAAMYRRRRLILRCLRLWKTAAVARVIARDVDQERLKQFRMAVEGLSFGRGGTTPAFTLPDEEDEEDEQDAEELFDHEDEEVAFHHSPLHQLRLRLSDSEMEHTLQQHVQQRSELWNRGGALTVVAGFIHSNPLLKHFASVDVGLYTHDDSSSSSSWLRTRFGADVGDFNQANSQLSLYANSEKPPASTAIVFFECSRELARQQSEKERARTLNNDKRRMERVAGRLAYGTFIPTIVVLSWCESEAVECLSSNLNTPALPLKYLQIAPHSFDSQLHTLLESVDVGVRHYQTTTPRRVSAVFSPVALASVLAIHHMPYAHHIAIALVDSSIAILNEAIRATNEAVQMLCAGADGDEAPTETRTLPLLKESVGVKLNANVKESIPLPTTLIEWLDDERFDFEPDVLLLRAEIAGWDGSHADTVYVMTRILDIVFSGHPADETFVVRDGVSLNQEELVEQTDIVKRTRRVVLQLERMAEGVRVAHEQSSRQRKREDELVRSPSPSPSPKKKTVSSAVLKDLVGSVRSSLFSNV